VEHLVRKEVRAELSVKLGRIMGIPVRIHYTMWFVFILIAWSLASGYMPSQYPGLGVVTYWAIGIASAVILFASVLIHELSHSYIAKKNGLPIGRITLFFFGGVSEMTEEPQDPGLEVRMAAAGPLMSFLIAGVLGGLWYLGGLLKAPVAVTATLGYGALINAVLGVFNLLPAFPLDGGRVFRGTVWKRSNSLIGATRTATRVSEGISLLMMVGGFVAIIFGDFVNGIWIIFLGWFIRSGAETSLRQTLVGETLSGITVGDIMTRDVLTVPSNITVQQLASEYFLAHPHGGYPVVEGKQVLGIVTMQCVRSVPKEKRETVTVKEAMIPCEKVVTVKPSVSALDALNTMARQNVGRLLILDGPQLLGIVTRGDLMRAIQTRQELGG
jgi:Zn-dependent protease/predicted transcriptional regulator